LTFKNRIEIADKRDQVISLFSQTGSIFVEPLLAKLEKSKDRSIRAKIIKIISDVGPAAIPDVTKRMHDAQPWFYLRNLARILGNIGDESVSKYLAGLLNHIKYQVRREALNSLYAVGGSHREEVFIPLLSTEDDRLKTDVVGMLGALKSDDAVPHLLMLLETETFVESKERIDLGVKICSVLGSIGSEDAIPLLSPVIEHKKGLIGKRKYHEQVQSAAKKAVKMIQNSAAT
jgi:HEAT repeat protein